MPSARLRKTFNYPSDTSSDEALESGLDAEDRKNLVNTLTTRDAQSTRTYTSLLLLLPGILSVATLPRLLGIDIGAAGYDNASAATTTTGKLEAAAQILSFAGSAYALWWVPLRPGTGTGEKERKKRRKRRGEESSRSHAGSSRSHAGSSRSHTGSSRSHAGSSSRTHSSRESRSPAAAPGRWNPLPVAVQDVLERHVILGNAVVCGGLILRESWLGRGWSEGMSVGGGLVPGVVLVVMLWARRELRGVDMEGLSVEE